MLAEFSESPVGRFLSASVASSPHFISPSIVGQSLLFLSDYAEIAQKALHMDTNTVRVVLQDRGFLSKFVYQLVVLRASLGEARARQLLDAIMTELPRPDLTILLRVPLHLVRSRLETIRPGWTTPPRLAFIDEADNVFERSVSEYSGRLYVCTVTPEDTPQTVAERVWDVIQAS